MIKVLMVSSECTPFSKTGGLADVIGSLPKALIDKEVDIRVITPLYGIIPKNYKGKFIFLKHIYVNIGWRSQYCGIFQYELDGIIYYFIDNEYYFNRDSIYGHYDEAEIYAFFCRSVLQCLPSIGFCPDVIHCHDWQAGMVPVLLETQYRADDFYRYIKTLFTIHNLKYQGIFPKSVLGELLSLGDEYFTPDKLEIYGNINYMKGGLVYSNLLSTVSPSYALEIQTEYYGEALDGILSARSCQLFGILNGIDYDEYNPKADNYIYCPYSINDMDGKIKNKLKLQEDLSLDVSADIPVISIVSRLTPQKGLDLVLYALDQIVASGAELIILGTGDRQIEKQFIDLAQKHKGRISASITFDTILAHKIYAGSDLFLMPSMFEPCGLGQIIALRYGTLPLVRETGGLKDTVISFNEFTGQGNGFSFKNYNADDMLYTIKRALNFFRDRDTWNMLIKNSMECDFSWKSSAVKYTELYEKLINCKL